LDFLTTMKAMKMVDWGVGLTAIAWATAQGWKYSTLVN
jgi:hypothetical protein